MIRCFSFGAGVQSVAIARMSLDGELPPLDHMIFADTGAELPSTYEAAEKIKAACHNKGVGFHVVKNERQRSSGRLYDDLMQPNARGRGCTPPLFVKDEKGTGFTRRQCTGDFKIDPIRKKLKELGGVGRRRKFPEPVVEQWLGISGDEKQRMKTSDKPWLRVWHPLIEAFSHPLHRSDCEQWLARNGYEIPEKSACFFCPYQSRRRWRELRDNHPEYWRRAVKIDYHLREYKDEMGLKGMPYLHRDGVPLDKVDLRSPAERAGQSDWIDDGFDDECAGVCGV